MSELQQTRDALIDSMTSGLIALLGEFVPSRTVTHNVSKACNAFVALVVAKAEIRLQVEALNRIRAENSEAVAVAKDAVLALLKEGT